MDVRVFDLKNEDWQRLRQDLTTGVVGKPLLSGSDAGVKLVLTRVAPGGEFSHHQDPYHHVFWFIEGRGEGWLGDERYGIAPGRVVHVPAGTGHGYRNTGEQDLLLLTANLPAGR